MHELQVQPTKFDYRKLPALSKLRMESAELPALYVQARNALRECWRIDEVKDISDKHVAIAQYAKQIKDDSLLKYAQRIKLRALERIGELLDSLPDDASRRDAGKKAGIAPTTRGRAQKFTTLPARVRTQLIDQENPPNSNEILQIADRYHGRNLGYYRHQQNARHKHGAVASVHDKANDLMNQLSETLWDFHKIHHQEWNKDFSIKAIANAVAKDDIHYCLKHIQDIKDTLEEYEFWLENRSE